VAPQQLGAFEALDVVKKIDRQQRRVLLEDYTSDYIPFEEAWQRQREYFQLHADRLDRARSNNGATPSSSFVLDDSSVREGGVDRVIFLQHSPVYTLGTASDPAYILNSSTTTASAVAVAGSSIPIVRMDRGGEVTYHGPGQLVVYPILDLRHYRQDIHWYMRALEEAVIVALHEFGLPRAVRDKDTTGVWIDNHKVAAMGVKCRKWITQHGLAVNVEPQSLQGFDGIVPCGLEGRVVGCISQFAGRIVRVQEFSPYLEAAIEQVFHVQLLRQINGHSNKER
jgi:lipoyl(octanoyl) transferase